ncbi:MAG: MgtC/SapB family protein [Planctomycetota bacterium]|nr:MAG: MgtC/SapB family protein [Planctomycetota bacterium]
MRGVPVPRASWRDCCARPVSTCRPYAIRPATASLPRCCSISTTGSWKGSAPAARANEGRRMPDADVLQRLGIALLLGLLVGIQREHAASRLAGLRTVPLFTLLGSLCAWVDGRAGFAGVCTAAGFAGLIGVVVVGKIHKLRQQPEEAGSTTDAALLLMYAVGVAAMVGPITIAVIIGVTTAILLQFKGELHGIVRRLGDEDLRAIMQFALITGIILPVLPNESYGPFGVWNPFEIWLMVVLIVGISLAGYITYKFFGDRAGVIVGGLLGGAISSTATTVSYARRSHADVNRVGSYTAIILIATAVVNVRVLIEVSVVAPTFLPAAAVPLAVLMVATGLAAWVSLLRQPRDSLHGERLPHHSNPTELKSALVFAFLYSVVTFALELARSRLGESATFVVAALSGLTDMDAITLSTSRLVASGDLPAEAGWRLIVVATMSNIVFKAAIAVVAGTAALGRRVASYFLVPLAVGGGLLLFAEPINEVIRAVSEWVRAVPM